MTDNVSVPDWVEVIEWPQDGAARRGVGGWFGVEWRDGPAHGYFPVTRRCSTRAEAEALLRGVAE